MMQGLQLKHQISNNPEKGSKLILEYNKEDDKMFVQVKKPGTTKKKKTEE